MKLYRVSVETDNQMLLEKDMQFGEQDSKTLLKQIQAQLQ